MVGNEPATPSRVASSSLPKVTEAQFFESLNEHGQPVFVRLLALAREHSYPIHWGTKGFSMNVDLNGTHVAFCYGYPPDCVFSQSVYTALVGHGGLLSKVDVADDVVGGLYASAQATGLFQPAGRELKCLIDRSFSDDEIDVLVSWYQSVIQTIEGCGLKGQKE